MSLATDRGIRYDLYTRASATETPHPIEIIEVVGCTTRREPGGETLWVEFAARRLV
jgi:hypothetical protein